MKAHLAISSNWNSRDMDDGRPLVDAAHGLGLDALELGYALTHRQADDIRAAVRAREITVTSVHAFCPVPMGATSGHPEIFTICERDAHGRARAIDAVLDSARFAAEVGARAVVLHAGRVTPVVREAKALESLVSRPSSGPGLLARLFGGRPHAPDTPWTFPESAARRREKLYDRRTAKAQPFLDALRASLDTLVPAFEGLGVRLGLENLPTYDAIPNEPEMTQLLGDYGSPFFGYWHDLGHGQVRANLGYIHHASVVRRLSPRLVGMHIHDVVPPAGDHVMPPRGKTDFSSLAFLADLDIPAVLEPAPGTPVEEIREGIAFLRATWDRPLQGEPCANRH